MGLFWFVLRQLAALAVAAWLLLVFVLGADEIGLDALPLLLKGAIVLPGLVLLYVENLQLRRRLEHRTHWLERNRRPLPRRLDRWVRRWRMWPLYLGSALCILILRKVMTLEHWGAGDSWNLLITTVLLRGITSSLAGAWTSWRYWLATLRLPGKWKAPFTMPLVVACQGVLLLAVSLFTLPHPAWFRAGAEVVMALAQAKLDQQGQGRAELLVTLESEDDRREVEQAVAARGGTLSPAVDGRVSSATLRRVYVAQVPTTQVLPLAVTLGGDPENVSTIEPNTAVHVAEDRLGASCPRGRARFANDPLAGGQLALRQIGADSLGATPTLLRLFHRPVTLAVIDTGVLRTHPDLSVLQGQYGVEDAHGTAVAGIAAAVSQNGTGMASPNWDGDSVHILSLPEIVTGARADDVVDALYDAVRADARVVLMAFGAQGIAPKAVRSAVRYAQASDLVLVAAAGNRGTQGGRASGQWPANIPGVVAVTSTGPHGRSAFSNRGDVPLTISAPGEDVCAPLPDGTYQRQSGTSMSAALVAGSVAALRAQCATASADEVIRHLFSHSSGNRLRLDSLLDSCPF